MIINSGAAYRAKLLSATMLAGMVSISAVSSGTAHAQTDDGATGTSVQGQGAQVQSTSETPESGIEEILVTAQFRSQNVQDTPIAITAISATALEVRSQTDIVQAANNAPGVTLMNVAGGSNNNAISASIRGVGQLDFNPAMEPGVGIYVDDVYYAQLTGSLLDLLDVDRVEVLRGPQGTLQGKNSIGGAVKMFSRKPTGEDGATASLTYGSYNRIEGRASADFSIVPNKLFARISMVGKKQDGYIRRLDFACANPTLTYTDVNGVVHTNVPNPIPVGTTDKSCLLGREGGQDVVAGRLLLRWAPNDSIDNVLIADYSSSDSEPAPATLLGLNDGSTPDGPRTSPIGRQNIAVNGVPLNTIKVPQLIPDDPFVSYATFSMAGGQKLTANGAPVTTSPLVVPAMSTLRGWGISNNLEWHLADDLSLTSITAYRKFTSTTSADGDVSPLNNALGIDTLRHRQFSQELRLSGNLFNNVLEYTVGGFYFDQTTVYTTNQYTLYSSAIFHFIGDDPVETTTVAAFAHSILHLTDKFELSAGIRYTDDKKTYTFSRRHGDTFGGAVELNGVPSAPVICPIPNPPGVPGAPYDCAPNFNYQVFGLDGASAQSMTKRVDWRLAATYHWTPDFMTYAQVSTGFKGGGINPRPFNTAQVLSFGPETLTAYEVGAKSTLFGKIRLNGTVFLNKAKGIQLITSDCAGFVDPQFSFPCAMPINGGDATVWGAELEGEIRPVYGLVLDGSVGYIDFKYDRTQAGAGIPITAVAPFTSKWKWNVGAQYEIDMETAGSITPRIDVDSRSDFFTHPQNVPGSLVEGYTVANARLTWASEDRTLSASLEVTNLFDKFYYVNKFDLLKTSGTAVGQPAMPRRWAVTLKKRF